MMTITIVCSIQPQLVTGQNEILLSTALSHLNKIHAFLNRRYVACSLVCNHKKNLSGFSINTVSNVHKLDKEILYEEYKIFLSGKKYLDSPEV